MVNENGNNRTVSMTEPEEPAKKAEVKVAAAAEETLVHCPNCNGPGIRKGKTILCQTCDASFRFTKEGPRVEELGPFDKLEERVTKLEGGGVVEPETAQPAEPETAQPAEPISAQPAEPEDNGI